MTENEAIEFLKGKYPLWGCDEDEYENAQIAIQALEEIQQYRAIGTVEEVKSIVYIGKWGYKKGYNEAIDEFAEQMKELVYKWIDKGIIAVGCIDEIAEQLKAGGKNE